jgi:hypothetical protein
MCCSYLRSLLALPPSREEEIQIVQDKLERTTNMLNRLRIDAQEAPIAYQLILKFWEDKEIEYTLRLQVLTMVI